MFCSCLPPIQLDVSKYVSVSISAVRPLRPAAPVFVGHDAQVLGRRRLHRLQGPSARPACAVTKRRTDALNAGAINTQQCIPAYGAPGRFRYASATDRPTDFAAPAFTFRSRFITRPLQAPSRPPPGMCAVIVFVRRSRSRVRDILHAVPLIITTINNARPALTFPELYR